MEEQAAEETEASGEANARDGRDQAVFPAGGGGEEGGIQQSAEGKKAEQEGYVFAQIEEQAPTSESGTLRCGETFHIALDASIAPVQSLRYTPISLFGGNEIYRLSNGAWVAWLPDLQAG